MAFNWTDRVDGEDVIFAEDVNALAHGISSEAANREIADMALDKKISDEAAARKDADAALDGRVKTVEDKAHTHENKTVLDGITAEDILNWNDKITYEPATSSANGLMSAEDKAKLDGIAEGATKTVVDNALNAMSTNPLQNKVVTTELKKKVSVYKVSDFIGADTYYRLPFKVGEYFILKNDGTEDISKLLYGYNESWYNPSAYYWFSNTIKAGNTALCYMKEDIVDAGDIDGHDGEILSYELNESFAQILQNQSKITALQQQVGALDSTLAILKDNLGTMSDMLDLLNGVTEEST